MQTCKEVCVRMLTAVLFAAGKAPNRLNAGLGRTARLGRCSAWPGALHSGSRSGITTFLRDPIPLRWGWKWPLSTGGALKPVTEGRAVAPREPLRKQRPVTGWWATGLAPVSKLRAPASTPRGFSSPKALRDQAATCSRAF